MLENGSHVHRCLVIVMWLFQYSNSLEVLFVKTTQLINFLTQIANLHLQQLNSLLIIDKLILQTMAVHTCISTPFHSWCHMQLILQLSNVLIKSDRFHFITLHLCQYLSDLLLIVLMNARWVLFLLIQCRCYLLVRRAFSCFAVSAQQFLLLRWLLVLIWD